MTKTSTTKNAVTSNHSDLVDQTIDEAEQQNIDFYNNIKPRLKKLVKNPSDETIEKILAYAKKK
jgi:hypothetical protein